MSLEWLAEPEERSIWPDGIESAVLVSFDVDAETLWLSRRKPATSPSAMAEGAYGPKVACPRILRMLEHRNLCATFFIPGWVAEKYPALVKEIAAEGHEIAYHGYRHEFDVDMSREEEESIFDRCDEIFDSLIERRPVGYRSPEGEMTEHTVEVLRDRGVLYSSTLAAADHPYFLDGDDGTVVEIPLHPMMDDSAHFFYTLREPPRRGISHPDDVFQLWRSEFDAVREAGGVFNLVLHPQIIGRASRLVMLDRLLSYFQKQRGVLVGTGETLARAWLRARE